MATCIVSATLLSLDGEARSGVIGTARLYQAPEELGGPIYSNETLTSTSNSFGVISWTLPQGVRVIVNVPGFANNVTVLVPSTSRADLADLMATRLSSQNRISRDFNLALAKLRQHIDDTGDGGGGGGGTVEGLSYLDVNEQEYTLITNAGFSSRDFSDVIHVSKNGNDSTGDGSSSNPYLTINKATSLVEAGECVYVHAGTYYEAVTFANSGSANGRITVIGERGPNGEFWTIVEPTTAIGASSWASEGSGVYSATLGGKPGVITYGGKHIPRLHDDLMSGSYTYPSTEDGDYYLALAADATVDTPSLGQTINFWDVPYALYGYKASDGKTYMRFPSGIDPDTVSLRWSPIVGANTWTYCFDLQYLSYVTISGFACRGGTAAIRMVSGANNIIENCDIAVGNFGLYTGDDPETTTYRNNIIRKNRFSNNFYAYDSPGSWSTVTADEGLAPYGLREYFYILFKYLVGADNEHGYPIHYIYGSTGNEICDNTFDGMSSFVWLTVPGGVAIHDNIFRNCSSGAIGIGNFPQETYTGQSVAVEIYDNAFVNCQYPLRFDSVDRSSASNVENSIRVYRNTFYSPPSANGGVGAHMFFHYGYSGESPATRVINFHLDVRHNSFGGCKEALRFNGYAYDRGGIPSATFVNNVFSNGDLVDFAGTSPDFVSLLSTESMVSQFDYNWVGTVVTGYTDPVAWFGDNNIVHAGTHIWGDEKEPDWTLPATSEAREMGLDLAGWEDFEAGYYGDCYAPDAGAVITGFGNEKVGLGGADRYWFNDTSKYIQTNSDGALDIVGFPKVIFPEADVIIPSASYDELVKIDSSEDTVTVDGTLAAANVTASGTLDVAGAVGIAGALTVNEASADVDVRIEGSTATHLLVTDGGLDAVQVGTTTAGTIADMRSTGTVLNEGGAATMDFRVESDTETHMLYVDANGETDGAAYIGGTTNGVRIIKGGNLKLLGTATQWEDLRVEPTARTTGANAPSFAQFADDSGLGDTGTSRGIYAYVFDDAAGGSEKEIHFRIQLPHAWAQTDIYLHVHWIGRVADTTAAPRWGLEYAWKEVGGTFGATASIVYTDGSNYTAVGTDADIVAGKHYISKFAAITPDATQDGISSILVARLFRDSANGADTYNATNADCYLLSVDAHYEVNSWGSATEYSKEPP